MKNLYVLIVLVCICFVLPDNQVNGQDVHYSQFYNSPHTMNPALSGIYNGDKKYLGSLRDQWRWVPVPWFTFGGAYDQKIYPDKSENHFFSIGGNFYHDRQGASRLNFTDINLTGTYSHLLNPENILTGGVSLGIGTRGFDTKDLTWNNQWNGEAYDPSLPSGEDFDAKRITFFETALGVNYRWQKSSRTHIDAGIGVFHLVPPSAGYYDNEDQKLPMNVNLSFIGRFELADKFDLQFNALQQLQKEYKETLLGALGIIHVNQDRGKETEVHAGLGYRTTGSLYPTLALQYTNYYVGLSYDIDFTDFNKEFDTARGAFELHFRYIITDVKSLKAFKTCPIY